MATWHGCAVSREPRSLPLIFLNSGKRIFKPRFVRTKLVRPVPANQLPAVTDNVAPLPPAWSTAAGAADQHRGRTALRGCLSAKLRVTFAQRCQ